MFDFYASLTFYTEKKIKGYYMTQQASADEASIVFNVFKLAFT